MRGSWWASRKLVICEDTFASKAALVLLCICNDSVMDCTIIITTLALASVYRV